MNNTVDLIKSCEGCRLSSYQDVGGVWTIGYGSTGPDIGPGLTWAPKQCETRLNNDLQVLAARMRSFFKVTPTLPQLSAMTSLTYNIGIGAFRDSTLLRLFNSGDVAGAAAQFSVWCKVNGQVVGGLVNRRLKERILFLS